MDASVNFYIYFFCNREIRARAAELYAGVKRQASSKIEFKNIVKYLEIRFSTFSFAPTTRETTVWTTANWTAIPIWRTAAPRSWGRCSRQCSNSGGPSEEEKNLDFRKKREKKIWIEEERTIHPPPSVCPATINLEGKSEPFLSLSFYLLPSRTCTSGFFPAKKEGKEKGFGLKNIFSDKERKEERRSSSNPERENLLRLYFCY